MKFAQKGMTLKKVTVFYRMWLYTKTLKVPPFQRHKTIETFVKIRPVGTRSPQPFPHILKTEQLARPNSFCGMRVTM